MSFEIGTDAYGRFVGRYVAALAAAHADAAGVTVGDTALDVGCGSGSLLGELARRLGPERVAGVDPSRPFVKLARQTLPGVEVRLAHAESLPFNDDAFDIVMSQLVVNFMTDAHRGVSEMRRVARHTVASCVWDYADGMTMLRSFWDAALEFDLAAPDEARTMSYATPDELRSLWEAIGLRDVASRELVVSADYADFEDLWSPFLVGIGPAGQYVASLDEARQEPLRAAFFRRLGSPTGSFTLAARAWFVSGTV
jgi:ubiquinone/menaquinone biosynthesis C-methylase UbiE